MVYGFQTQCKGGVRTAEGQRGIMMGYSENEEMEESSGRWQETRRSSEIYQTVGKWYFR